MIIFLILLINQIQSPEQEIIIEDDGLLAEGNDEARETAGGEDCGRFTKFFFHAVHDTVEHGGVSVKEINPGTMESKKISGLYFTGEVLDLDAVTGGYNLQIAWSTAYLAAQAIQ